jgi:S-adenosylhomocysteine hydrolase
MPKKRSVASPHCGSTSFVMEGYHEFKKVSDASRENPVVVTTEGLKDYVS